MPIPPYIREMRSHIGHGELYLPAVNAIVINDRRELLLHKSRDTGTWLTIGGFVDPLEQPADAVVREVFEETGVRVEPLRVSGVYAGPEVTYPNGDQCIYITIAFLCKPLGGESCVNDDESLDVRYFPLDGLPPLREDHQMRLRHALEDRTEAFFFAGRKA